MKINGDFISGNVGDLVANSINLKNLFNMSALDKGMPNNNTGDLMTNGVTSLTISGSTLSFATTTNYRGGTTDYISSESLKKYVAKCTRNSEDVGMGIWCYDSSKNYLGTSTTVSNLSSGNTFQRVFQTVENTKLIRIAVFSASTGSFSASNIKVEEGTTPTPFKMYQELGYVYGKNDNGEYLRFIDGTLICWNKITYSESVAVTTTSGALYRSSAITPFPDYPYKFKVAPAVSFEYLSDTGNHMLWIVKANSATATAPRGIYLFCSSSYTCSDVVLSYIAIGRWK